MRTKGYNRTSKLYDTFLTVPKYMYSSVFNTYFIFGRGDFEYFKVSGHSRGTRNRHKTSGGGQDQGKRAWDRDPRSCGIRYFSYLSSIIRADQIIVERTVLPFHCIALYSKLSSELVLKFPLHYITRRNFRMFLIFEGIL